MRQRFSIGSTLFWLQIAVCVFLIALGIIGLEGGFGLFGRNRPLFRDDTLQTVASLVELAGGAILLVALFTALPSRLLFVSGLVLLGLWILLLLDGLFLTGFGEPGFLVWLNRLSWYLIPAFVLWLIARQYG